MEETQFTQEAGGAAPAGNDAATTGTPKNNPKKRPSWWKRNVIFRKTVEWTYKLEKRFFPEIDNLDNSLLSIIDKMVIAGGICPAIYMLVVAISGYEKYALFLLGACSIWGIVALSVSAVVVLTMLTLFARKDLKNYEKGKPRFKRGLFIYLVGYMIYHCIFFIVAVAISLVILTIIIILCGVVGKELLHTNKYRLEDGTKVEGSDLMGYWDRQGNSYERDGKYFKEK